MVKRDYPLVPTVWFYYLITLLPVAGIIQVGLHSAADRFTYLPSVGLSMLVGVGVLWLWNKVSNFQNRWLVRCFMLSLVCFALAGMAWRTVIQFAVWENSESMWKAVIAGSKEPVPEGYYGLGLYYYEQGNCDEAITQFKRAVNLSPNYAAIHYNLGNAYIRKGMIGKAIFELERSIVLGSRNPAAYNNLGNCYGRRGEWDKALAKFRQALAINPSFEDAYANMGATYYRKGNLKEALDAFRKALSLNDGMARVHYRTAKIYYDTGNFEKAVTHCRKAMRLGYRIPPSFFNRIRPYLEQSSVGNEVEENHYVLPLSGHDKERANKG